MSVGESRTQRLKFLHIIEKFPLDAPKVGNKLTDVNLVLGTAAGECRGKGKETTKAPEDFQERMTTVPAEMDWTSVVMTAYNS